MNTSKPNPLVVEEALSSNSTLFELAQHDRELPQLYSVIVQRQTAGRGQRGNSWHSEERQSLTFSFLIRSSGLLASEQYAVSELAAYGVMKTLARYLPEEKKSLLSIKWPNDIYYEERKIAGILIEHSITGTHIDYSVVGIGININEESFPEDLPNPISLRQIMGECYDLEAVHARIMKRFGFMIEPFLMGNYSEVHQRCMARLFRRRGLHKYRDANGVFLAEIKDVLPSGQIVLATEEGELRTYTFKEVNVEL